MPIVQRRQQYVQLGGLTLPQPSRTFALPEASFYPSPGNLEDYYKSIHNYILQLNGVVGSGSGFTAADLAGWRAFRNMWVDFYSKGPSQWFNILSDDPTIATRFHNDALQWEAYAISKGAKPPPELARPQGTPADFGDALKAIAGNFEEGLGLTTLVQRVLIYGGLGLFALGALYVVLKARK